MAASGRFGKIPDLTRDRAAAGRTDDPARPSAAPPTLAGQGHEDPAERRSGEPPTKPDQVFFGLTRRPQLGPAEARPVK